ncbi:MAG: ligand-binding protein SH3 [Oscillochloridaceae bacterium umkhey_bin13]
MNEPTNPDLPTPFELIESARAKYTLAQTRVRRGPPELALLSLHGSLEDVLRAYGLQRGLPEAVGSFPVLLEALTLVSERPLSPAEANGIQRMHQLRARVAHGEALSITSETITAYQRLVARLLPRYGVVVAPPEEPDPAPMTATTIPGRRGETQVALERANAEPDPRRATTQTSLARRPAEPRRERTVYPDTSSVRYPGRPLPSGATRDLPIAQEMLAGRRVGYAELDRAERLAAFWGRSQAWLLPGLIIISIFLIGIVISASLQQMRTIPVVPTAIVPSVLVAPPGQVLGADQVVPPPDGLVPLPTPEFMPEPPTAPPPGGFVIGGQAYVRPEVGPVNVRVRPGTAADSAIVTVLQPNSMVEIIGGPVEADGFTWWQVRAASFEGWSAGQLLEVR